MALRGFTSLRGARSLPKEPWWREPLSLPSSPSSPPGSTSSSSPCFIPSTLAHHQSLYSTDFASSHPPPPASPQQKDLIGLIYEYSKKKQTGVSLKTLMDFGNQPTTAKLVQIGDWLLKEIPIRLARQVYYLDKLPYGLCLMPSVKKVRNWYVQSFAELYNFPKGRIVTAEDEERFTKLVTLIYQRHSPTLITMAKGLFELKQERRNSFGENDLNLSDYAEIHQFLDSFYMSRIGLRMLIGQHIELHRQKEHPQKDYSGLICKRTFPVTVAKDAIEDARYMCMKNHLDAPEVTVHGQTELAFPYVPEHLYYIFFELLKNSMRAVVEFHRDKPRLPPIRVIIADSENNEDVSIKISDEGGGIPRSGLNRIWSYLYSTANFNLDGLSKEDYPDFGRDAPLAGLGYGLPLSRLYSRYFGGDLQVISMESYGTPSSSPWGSRRASSLNASRLNPSTTF